MVNFITTVFKQCLIYIYKLWEGWFYQQIMYFLIQIKQYSLNDFVLHISLNNVNLEYLRACSPELLSTLSMLPSSDNLGFQVSFHSVTPGLTQWPVCFSYRSNLCVETHSTITPKFINNLLKRCYHYKRHAGYGQKGSGQIRCGWRPFKKSIAKNNTKSNFHMSFLFEFNTFSHKRRKTVILFPSGKSLFFFIFFWASIYCMLVVNNWWQCFSSLQIKDDKRYKI